MNVEKKIVMMDVDRITPAMFNPPVRTLSQNILSLKKSIEEVGIMYPLIVAEDGELIDGHRRLACAKSLNLKKVPTITAHGSKEEIRKVFVLVSDTARRLGTRDEVYIYLSGGPVSAAAKKSIDDLEKLIGRKDLEYVAESRTSAKSVLHTLTVLKSYLGEMSDSFWSKAARWIIYNRQQFVVRVAIQGGMEKGLMVAAIEANTPIG